MKIDYLFAKIAHSSLSAPGTILERMHESFNIPGVIGEKLMVTSSRGIFLSIKNSEYEFHPCRFRKAL